MTETATERAGHNDGIAVASSDWLSPSSGAPGDNSRGSEQTFPPVLDATCGSRMMWFDKKDRRALFFDQRRERHDCSCPSHPTLVVNVDPDVLGDFTNLPFPDESFWLVVFDPPHLSNLGTTGIIAKKYGRLIGDWECAIREGLSECMRVLKRNGTLIFKWCSTEISLPKVLALTNEKPLFGHNTGNHAKTHWIVFHKGAR